MRLKLILQNLLHHFGLTCFIILSFSIIISTGIFHTEIDRFTYHLSYDEYHLVNNDFDIVIESNTGLSLKGTRGDDNLYDDAYDRRIGFYNSTVLSSINDQYNVVTIYEGTNENFNSAFNLALGLDSNSAAITLDYKNKYNLEVGDKLKLYLGEKTFEYAITNIVDSTGMVDGEYVFITGDNLKSFYAFKNMYNLILLDVKDSVNYQEIYSHIQNEYQEYSVKNINDVEMIQSLAHSTLSEIMVLFSIIFVLLIIVLMNMLDQKLKKQEQYFTSIGQQQYFIINKFIAYLLMMTIGFIISFILVESIFDILVKSFHCRFTYQVLIKSYLFGLIVPILLIIFKSIFSLSKFTLKRKNYLMVISLLTVISGVLCLLLKNSNTFVLFKVILIIFFTMLITELLFLMLKYLLPFNIRVYIYDLCKKNFILTILQISYIFIFLVVYIMVTCFNTYTTQVKDLNKMIDVDKVVISKYIISENNKYDVIRLNENGKLLNRNIDIVVGVNSVNYDKYISYGSLTDEEKTLFDSSDNYIVLSKYYKNVCNVDLNDSITLTVNGKDENYKVLKFVDHVYKNIVIVNNSNYLYYGYILEDDNIDQGLLSDFNKSNYLIVNLQNSIKQYSHTSVVVLSIIQYFILGFILLIVFFSVYVVYQEYLYNHNSLKKMKLLGYSNKIMFKVSLIKFIYNLLLVLIVGSIFVILIIRNFDDLLRIINSVMYISVKPAMLYISLSITVLSMIIGYIYSFIKYRKL